MMTITTEALRAWLEEGYPVTILDVRPTAEYREWSIPTSLHIDAYEALKAHDPEALSGVKLPTDQPIVTVCGAGYTSRIATEQLVKRGFHALSLEGGMKAWSLAWNTAEIAVTGSTIRVIQVRRTGKGCLSYVIGGDTEAFVIDASLDPQVYLNITSEHGWQITSVFDTHIHADHLSRARQLAEQTGAKLFLPDQQRVAFPFTSMRDGDTLSTPHLMLTALHTPGHTPESTCYLLGNHMLFTGDTLFPTSVGRPDLHTTQEGAKARAEALYHSLHKVLSLPAETVVLPGHSSQPIPFDSVPISTTLAQVDAKVAMLHLTCADFVRQILSRLPATPLNSDRIVTLNEQGLLPEVPLTELEAGANRCALL
jgi:glyoxylase-like metal-dependent hydrolase (beta-lactamase superfamily II)/rhodanese-related sulfurtransferase